MTPRQRAAKIAYGADERDDCGCDLYQARTCADCIEREITAARDEVLVVLQRLVESDHPTCWTAPCSQACANAIDVLKPS